MSIPCPLFAVDFSQDFLQNAVHGLGPSSKGSLAIIGAICLVTCLAVIWAVYLRRRPNRHSSRHSHYHSGSQRTAPGGSGGADAEPGKRRKWHRRRRAHRPRNPTLAETGGLPPLREEPPAEPFP
jgi:hypothetical protein